MEWWKDTARTYGKVTAEIRAMTDEEFRAYQARWRDKLGAGLNGSPSGTTAKWWGFRDAVCDEEKRRAHSRALRPGKAVASDEWLEGVLTYLYEEHETPKQVEV
jgi:hypothetical protein